MVSSRATIMEFKVTRSIVSKEALEFLEDSMCAKWETINLTPESVKCLRYENSEVASQGCITVVQELGTIIQDETIQGISVQWVSPKLISGPEIVLYLYGGGFIVGCPEDDLSITARIADEMGRRVCVPRYRLAPEHKFPDALNDVKTIYRSLSENQSLFLVGESAGGNLTLNLVIDALSTPNNKIKAVALLSPWIDLSHSGESHKLDNLDPTLSVHHFLTPASLAYRGDYSANLPQISPLFAEFPNNFPPTTISTGTRDLLYSDCTRLTSKLREKNIVVDLQITEGVWHVFEWYPNLPEAIESIRYISEFLLKFLLD